ncbi:Intermembrane space AAA protease IAP-1 [Echinococcus multilocularis]|uniref:Intermembrane space AAA protease IAP-1 n=1 Tax=Echinococcus multilocularis TaxID=6211 RepID=A0A0S4MMJ2_ECHMU|nr:Intermembrane space AAA protease IAP-1 [Echinococcus multilocularis]
MTAYPACANIPKLQRWRRKHHCKNLYWESRSRLWKVDHALARSGRDSSPHGPLYILRGASTPYKGSEFLSSTSALIPLERTEKLNGGDVIYLVALNEGVQRNCGFAVFRARSLLLKSR